MLTYARKTPQDLECGITVFSKVLGGKWKPCIIDLLSRGVARPSEMHRAIPEATPRVIDMQLSELETFGMVRKETQGGFPLRSDYYLTPLGETLVPIISAMDKWGTAHATHVRKVAAALQSYTE